MCISLYADTTPTTTTSTSTNDIGVDGLRCPNAHVNWGQDICYDAIFPLRLGGSDWFSIGTDFDSDEAQPNSDYMPNNPLCICYDGNNMPEFGLAVSFKTISRVYEVVRTPYCTPFLGGSELTEMGNSGFTADTDVIGDKGSLDELSMATYHVHTIAFPLLQILEFFTSTLTCEDGYYSGLDIMMMSEFLITWYHDEWALAEHPEVVIFANPITQATCVADCVATNVGYPIDTLFWCAGCVGSSYPFTGNINNVQSPVGNSQLAVIRMLSLLHRIGLAWNTSDEDALCGSYPYPIIKKSQYKLSMLFPVAQASGKCSHPLGRSPFIANTEWRTIPGTGEDYLYMQNTKVNCCVR